MNHRSNLSAMVSLLFALAVAASASVATASDAPEDFTVFLRNFITNAHFRAQRVVCPLHADLRNSCGDEPEGGTEKWRATDVAKKLIVPLSRSELAAEQLSQQITQVSGTEVTVFQFREEADSYLITYTFRLRNRRWYLTAYEDASC